MALVYVHGWKRHERQQVEAFIIEFDNLLQRLTGEGSGCHIQSQRSTAAQLTSTRLARGWRMPVLAMGFTEGTGSFRCIGDAVAVEVVALSARGR